MYSFSYLEPVCCSMSSSNCYFLTCTLVSQEAGQVVWYPHLFQTFPQFVVIHIVKGFGIVNKAEIESSRKISWILLSITFLIFQQMLAIWSLVPLPFLNQLEHLEVSPHVFSLSSPARCFLSGILPGGSSHLFSLPSSDVLGQLRLLPKISTPKMFLRFVLADS